jgi:hypothetical protein
MVVILRGSIQNLLQRVSEAEGFGVRANFQELAEAVDRVELRAEIAAKGSKANGQATTSSQDLKVEVDSTADATTMRLRAALEEARLKPKASVRAVRKQLISRVEMWDRRVQEDGYDREFNYRLQRLEAGGWITSDLKSSIATALSLGVRLAGMTRNPSEAQAVSYLTLIARLERLLDDEIDPHWQRLRLRRQKESQRPSK